MLTPDDISNIRRAKDSLKTHHRIGQHLGYAILEILDRLRSHLEKEKLPPKQKLSHQRTALTPSNPEPKNEEA